MDHSGKEILVTGATGTQGRAVIRHLTERGYTVRALCRDVEKPAARALAEDGIRVFKGDLEDRASLDSAMAGAYGVFSVQNYWDGFPARLLGVESEIRQGKNVADAAKAAGVTHFVFASACGANLASGVAHLDSKWVIERYLTSLRLPATVIRPVFFMDNFDKPTFGFQQAVLEGRLELPLIADKKLQMVAADDIGHFTALAFDRPGDFIGASFDLAGDALTMPEIADAFTRIMGRPVRFTGDPARLVELASVSEELAQMFAWFNARGFESFIPALRALHPNLSRFERYLRRAGWADKAPPA